MTGLLLSMLLWGAIGSLIFTGALVVMRALGVIDATRDPEGRFKRLSVKALMGFLFVVALMIGFPALGTLSIVGRDGLSFFVAWGVAYSIYFIINLYDFVVLDYLVVVRWHPAFLHLPDTDYYRTTRPHAEGFVRGTLIGLPATAASAGLALLWN